MLMSDCLNFNSFGPDHEYTRDAESVPGPDHEYTRDDPYLVKNIQNTSSIDVRNDRGAIWRL